MFDTVALLGADVLAYTHDTAAEMQFVSWETRHVRLSQTRDRRLYAILNEVMNNNEIVHIASKMAGLTAVGMFRVHERLA
jgi:hypothetical protein